MTATVSLSFRVAPEKAKQLDRLASATDRSRSWLLEQALDAYLELQAWQIEHVKQGIEDSRAGRAAAHDDVAAWLDSWGTDHEQPPPKPR